MHTSAFWHAVFKEGVTIAWQIFLKSVNKAIKCCHSISQTLVKLRISPSVSNKYGVLTECFEYFKYCSKVIDFFWARQCVYKVDSVILTGPWKPVNN